MNHQTRFTCAAAAVLAGVIAAPVCAGGTITLSPSNNIQSFIDTNAYDKIILSPGVYTQSIVINQPGSFQLIGTDPLNPAVVGNTVLEGDFTSSMITVEPVAGNVWIGGITIRKGRATFAAPNDRGGAINVPNGGAITVDHCVLENSYGVYGGAMYANNAMVTMDSCEVVGNSADSSGGGLYLNLCTSVIRDCSLRSGVASGDGGGIRAVGGTLDLTDTKVFSNSATTTGDGGGIHTTAETSLTRCEMRWNYGRLGGGVRVVNGAPPFSVESCLFVGNGALSAGGGMSLDANGRVNASTFSDNHASGNPSAAVHFDGGSTSTLIVNSIFWANYQGVTGIAPASSSSVVVWSTTEQGYAGVANDTNDPLFVNAGVLDFRLSPGSPAIDSGSTWYGSADNALDYGGSPRVINDPETVDHGEAYAGATIDRGCYELQVQPVGPACAADGNGDGAVDFNDLLQILSAWGVCP